MLDVMLLKKKVSNTGTYRYVRLNNILPPSGTSYTTIGEIEIIDTSSGTNWCRQPGAVASASSSYPGQTPDQAIDGIVSQNPGNRWSSNGGVGQWFMVDFGQPRFFDSIQLALITGNNQDPVSFTIQGSTDGTNFTNLKTVNRGTYPTNVFTEVYKT
uniref:F5/8 type C domain-containing protein n=1 Tax=Burkholderia phage vB_BgluM-SURPRISE13 TaxID=3159457 RepID=A0AAU7PFM7_9VIRU